MGQTACGVLRAEGKLLHPPGGCVAARRGMGSGWARGARAGAVRVGGLAKQQRNHFTFDGSK